MSIGIFYHSLAKCGRTINIQLRELAPSGFDSAQPVEQFTTIFSPSVIIKTLGSDLMRGERLFGGVSIVKEATHIFCTPYDVTIDGIEQANHFVQYDNRRYRILQIVNVNELDKLLIIQAAIRGDDSKSAAEA